MHISPVTWCRLPNWLAPAVVLEVEHEATNSAKRLGGKELDFRIGVAQHHQACWVLLETLEMDGLGSDGLTP